MHLQTNSCEIDYAQKTFLLPGTIGKCSLEGEHSFLTKLVLIVNSCFIQYNALIVKYVIVAQNINSFFQKWLVFSQFQTNLFMFEV